MGRRLGIMLLAVTLGMASSTAWSQEKTLKIGLIEDMSGPYADVAGPGSIVAAKLAVEDFGPVLGGKVEILTADHFNKPDTGITIAKRWFEVDGVSMITGLSHSGVALGVRNIAKSHNVIDMAVGAGTSDLSGKACSPTSFHWVYDSFGLAATIGTAVVRAGADSVYQILVDYAFATAMARDAKRFVEAAGGKEIGTVRVPLNTADYSSFILQAQSSKAKAVLLALAGADFVNFIKQAREFGMFDGSQKIASFITFANDIHALGPKTAEGLLSSEAFYWDLDDKTRAFSKRFFERFKRMPTSVQAGVYSAIYHYLTAVKAAGTTETAAVAAKIRELPVNDFMTHNGHVRIDGRVPRDMYLFQAKGPKESTGEWDIMKVIQKVSAEEATRPLAESECPLVTKK